MGRRYCWNSISILILGTTLCSLAARAQSDPSAGQAQQPAPPARPGDVNPTDPAQQGQDAATDNVVKTPLLTPPEMEVRAIGSSLPLPTYSTFLRWGPVYVRNIELLESYDRINAIAGSDAGIFNQGNFTSTVLSADIVYDRQLGQNRLTLQYTPRVTVVNGQIGADYLNQTIGFNWNQQLSPRWTLGISNTFGYFSVRNLYGDYYLDINTVTGSAIPSSFLDASGSWLNTSTQASFNYALSPTSSLSIAPFFGYGRTTGQINGPATADIYQYGAKFAWTKQLSASRSVTADYYYRQVGDLGNGTPYQSGEISIYQQLGPSTVLGATGGVLSEGFSSGRQWTFSGGVQASRTIGRSAISIGYYRGFPLFSELNSQGVAQRVEASFRLNLSQRWYTSVRAAYEDSISSNTTTLSGKYATVEFGYNLTQQVSFFSSYAHKIQSGNDQNLLAGTRDYVLGGIRWTARPVN